MNSRMFVLKRRPTGIYVAALWIISILLVAVGSKYGLAGAVLTAIPGSFAGLIWLAILSFDVDFVREWQRFGFKPEELPRNEADRMLLRPRVQKVLRIRAVRARCGFYLRDKAQRALAEMNEHLPWSKRLDESSDSATLRARFPEDVSQLEVLANQLDHYTQTADTEWRQYLQAWDFFDLKISAEHRLSQKVLCAALDLRPRQETTVWKEPHGFMRHVAGDASTWPPAVIAEAAKSQPSIDTMAELLFRRHLSTGMSAV